LQVRRTKPVSFLTTLDAPVMELNCDRRISSTGSPQSLMLMNGDFVLKQAEAFGNRVLKDAPITTNTSPDGAASSPANWEPQLSRAWQLAYQRPILPDESALCSQFLQQQVADFTEARNKNPEQAAVVNLCQQLLSANEFLYVD
jgi:hypothetical protein